MVMLTLAKTGLPRKCKHVAVKITVLFGLEWGSVKGESDSIAMATPRLATSPFLNISDPDECV
jgi:hypothetical protein